MTDKKPRRKNRPRRTYINRPNVLNEAAEKVTNLALEHGLLINLADS
jgi:hypothetical protein